MIRRTWLRKLKTGAAVRRESTVQRTGSRWAGIFMAAGAIAAAFSPGVAGGGPTATAVCRHEPRGERGRFDAGRATDAHGRWSRESSGGAAPKIRAESAPSRLESALRPGAAQSERVTLAEKLPESWIGREVIFAPASRLARGARLPEEAVVVVTDWTSARERDAALAACASRSVVAGGQDLAARLGVTHRETHVRIRAVDSVELAPF